MSRDWALPATPGISSAMSNTTRNVEPSVIPSQDGFRRSANASTNARRFVSHPALPGRRWMSVLGIGPCEYIQGYHCLTEPGHRWFCGYLCITVCVWFLYTRHILDGIISMTDHSHQLRRRGNLTWRRVAATCTTGSRWFNQVSNLSSDRQPAKPPNQIPEDQIPHQNFNHTMLCMYV